MKLSELVSKVRNCCAPSPSVDPFGDETWTEWLFESCGCVDSDGSKVRMLTRGFENEDGRVLVKVITYKDGEFVESNVFTTDEELGDGTARSIEMTPPRHVRMMP